MTRYRVTSPLGAIFGGVCPPPIVVALWPGVDPIAVACEPGAVFVTFPAPVAPADLGPTVIVEEVA